VNDEFGGIAVDEPSTDEFGGVAVAEHSSQDEFGGIAVDDAQSNISPAPKSAGIPGARFNALGYGVPGKELESPVTKDEGVLTSLGLGSEAGVDYGNQNGCK